MPQENDLEGVQDQGGKHGGQKGMPKPEPKPPTRREPGRGHAPDQGIVRDERGQEQPRDKERAQQVSRTDPTRLVNLTIARVAIAASVAPVG
jgi:hypothetical protein